MPYAAVLRDTDCTTVLGVFETRGDSDARCYAELRASRRVNAGHTPEDYDTIEFNFGQPFPFGSKGHHNRNSD